MTGLLDAILVGAALSLLSGLLALIFAGWHMRRGRGGTGLWRAGRWAAVAPLLLAPVIYAIPEMSIEPMHAPLPMGPGVSPGFADAALPASDPLAGLMATDWRLALAALYLAGLLVALGRSVMRHVRRKLLLADSREAPGMAQDYLSILAARVGVETPDFRLRDGLASPLLTGWTPVILASPALLDDTSASRYALTHELVHYRRGDEQDRLVGAALLALLWFHWPLRRIEHELHEAREIDCDAESLEALGGAERKPYAATLITMMRSPAQLVSAFGPDDRRHREMRIKAILSGRPARPSSRLLAVMLAGVSILPVACAQAALTDRTRLAVDLADPTEHRVLHFLNTPDGEAGLHEDSERHQDHSDDTDSHTVFLTEDGVELRIDGDHADPEATYLFVPETGDAVFLAARDGEVGRHAMVDEDGHVTRLLPGPDQVWETEDGTRIELVAPDAAAPVAPARLPALVDPETKPADFPRSLRRLSEPAPLAFPHPVTQGRTTSSYGNRPARPAGAPIFHGGMDIAAPTGTAVWAPDDGAVIHAQMGFNGSDRWGNTVVIQHADGWQTVYAHLDRIDVAVGDTLLAGSQIGTIGTTGASTGPHVHVELRHQGERVDPATRLTGQR
jgi:bla regulator protein blaR1